MLLLLLACSQTEQPPACDRMCDAAAALYGGCLTDWGADWSAAGYADEEAFVGSCSTWGWQMALLQEDAIERGAWTDRRWLSETCDARAAAFSAEEASCSSYTEVEWNNVPWAPDDTGS
jgi:hypothetical protein